MVLHVACSTSRSLFHYYANADATAIMLRYFPIFFQVGLCKVNRLLKHLSQYLAALADWFILSRDIKNRKFVELA